MNPETRLCLVPRGFALTHRAVRGAAFVVGLGTIGSLSGCGASQELGPKTQITEAWAAHIGQAGQSEWTGTPALAGGQVIVENENNVVALSQETGRVNWTTRIKNAPVPSTPSIVVASGAAMVGDRLVTALELSSGAVRWTFAPDSLPQAVEAVADEDTYYTGQRGIPIVYALDLVTGALRWRTNVGTGWQFPAYILGISRASDTLYVGIERWLNPSGGSRKLVVVAVSSTSGVQLWNYETPDSPHGAQNAPIVHGNLLFINDLPGGGVIAIDRFTHAEVWRFAGPPTAAGPTTQSDLADGVLYVGLGGGYVYALDASTGRVLWRHQTMEWVFGITHCGPSIFSTVQNIERYDAASGSITGHSKTGGVLTSGIVADGTRIFVAGDDGVHAFLCN